MFGSCGPTSYNHVSNYEVGDICVSPNHCGIYIGNGQMVYAPTFGDVNK